RGRRLRDRGIPRPTRSRLSLGPPRRPRDRAGALLAALALELVVRRGRDVGRRAPRSPERRDREPARISGDRLDRAPPRRGPGGGPDELALRFLPAFAGWCSIPLAYWAFRPKAGRLRSAAAALLLAASSWHVYWSQNARFYTLAQALSLAGAGFLVRGLWRRSLPSSVLGFALAAAAAAFHPSAALMLPAFVLAPFLVRFLARGARPLPDVRPGGGLLVLLALFLLLRLGWAWRTIENYIGQKPQSDPAHFLLTTGFYVTPLLLTAVLVGTTVALARRDVFHVFAAIVVAV